VTRPRSRKSILRPCDSLADSLSACQVRTDGPGAQLPGESQRFFWWRRLRDGARGRWAERNLADLADVHPRCRGSYHSVHVLRHHLGWWPTGGSGRQAIAVSDEPSATEKDSDIADADSPAVSTTVGSSTAAAATSVPPPVSIRLMPELDTATNRFRLGALNRGELGRFRAEVIDARNQDGDWIGPRSWPVPWLEDGSIEPKEIPNHRRPAPSRRSGRLLPDSISAPK
jgi:hypothetical protein